MKTLNSMLKAISFFIVSLSLVVHLQAREINYTVEKIWDNGLYNSFTSLVKYKNQYYCAFREGKSHIFDENGKAEGKIRIISSPDGHRWQSVCLLGENGEDYRDPQLSITPWGELMASIGVSVYRDRKLVAQYPHVCFSTDGIRFSKPERCPIEEHGQDNRNWIWKLTWHNNIGYTVNYFPGQDGTNGLWLMSTVDGRHYTKIHAFNIPDHPSEATIRFLPDGQMALLIRRDGHNANGIWATSAAPYTDWKLSEVPFHLGGPDFVVLDSTTTIAATRCHLVPRWCTTSVFKGNPQKGTWQQLFVLPSGGDTSYPGILIDGKYLWISYYSTHEGPKASIYLARIPIKTLIEF